MTQQIFINLAVADVEKSMGFYRASGFTLNPEFTSDHQKCMVWSAYIYVMLQSQAMFRAHSKKAMPDRQQYQAASYTLPVESLDRVNEIVNQGLEAGGTEPTPMIDEGYMQMRTVEDFDGHTWSMICLDMDLFRSRNASHP